MPGVFGPPCPWRQHHMKSSCPFSSPKSAVMISRTEMRPPFLLGSDGHHLLQGASLLGCPSELRETEMCQAPSQHHGCSSLRFLHFSPISSSLDTMSHLLVLLWCPVSDPPSLSPLASPSLSLGFPQCSLSKLKSLSPSLINISPPSPPSPACGT